MIPLMTWEALAVIFSSLTVFGLMVSLLAWVSWRRLARADREVRGDLRLSRRDRRAIRTKYALDPWWAS